MQTLSDDDMVDTNGFRRKTKAKRKLLSSLGDDQKTTVEDVLEESFSTRTTFDLEFLGQDKWRTISMRMLNKLGARLFMDRRTDNEPVIFLPAYVNGNVVGGIKARVEKVKGQLSYVESAGEWSMTQGLYPFDYAVELLKRKKLRFVVLVEGPRDAIKLCARGIPALAILGTQKWSEAKRDLLLSLDLDLVILYMDGDSPGRKANKRLKAELTPYVTTKVLSLTALAKELGLEELDPATVPREYMSDIWDLAKEYGAV